MSRQPSKWVRLKTDSSPTKKTHVELASETVRQFFFSARRKMASTKPPARPEIWADIYSTLRFDRKRNLEATNDCTWRLTCHNVFDANRHGWNGVAIFFINKKYCFTNWSRYNFKITMTSGRRNLLFPTPNPLLIFDRRPLPWYKFLSLPSLQLLLKSKMAAIMFVKEILSSHSPKSRLLWRLTITRYWLLFFNYKWYIPFRKHQMKVIFLGMNSDQHI